MARPSVTSGLLAAVATTAMALVLASSTGAPAGAAPIDCAAAERLQAARLLTDAATAYEEAAAAGLRCGSGPGYERTLRDQAEAAALTARGEAAARADDREEATASFEAALALDRQSTGAIEGLRALGGASPPSGSTTTTTSPFAAALELQRLGRDDDAAAATTKAIEGGARLTTSSGAPCPTSWGEASEPPTTTTTTADRADACALVPLVERSPEGIEAGVADAVDVVETYWRWIAAGAIAIALLWLELDRRRPRLLRWLPGGPGRPRRLLLQVTDESGTECKIVGAIATRLGEQLGREATGVGSDARTVTAANLGVSLPDLEQLPEQARWLVGLAQWIAKQRAVTLSVSLLPPTAGSVSCHASLRLPTGSTLVRGLDGRRRSAERIIRYRGPRELVDGAPTPPTHAELLELVSMVTAWALFEFGYQFRERSLGSGPGTGNPAAHDAYLDGLERLDHDSEGARSHFAVASRLDPDFAEAHLNLAYCQADRADHDDADASLLAVLAAVRKKIKHDEPAGTDPDWRWWHSTKPIADPDTALLPALEGRLDLVAEQLLALAVRAHYSRAVVAINKVAERLAPSVGDPDDDALQEAAVVVDRLWCTVRSARAGRADEHRAIERVALDVEGHAQVLWLGIRDLARKRSAPGPTYPGLPLDLEDGTDPVPGPYPDAALVDAVRALARRDHPGRSSYALACLWARDARLRALTSTDGTRPTEEPIPTPRPTPGSDVEDAIGKVAEHLQRAVDRRLVSPRGWIDDPDLRPLEPLLRGQISRR